MSISSELSALESWWHDLISHLFKHPNAPTVAPAAIQAVANVAAQPAPDLGRPVEGLTPLMASMLGKTSQTDAILDARVANEQPGRDPSGFDLGTVPSGNAKRNTLEGGKTYPFTFEVKTAQPLRLVLASELSQSQNDFGSVTVVVKQGEQVLLSVNHVANTGENFISLGTLQPGSYVLDLTVAKTDTVAVQVNPA